MFKSCFSILVLVGYSNLCLANLNTPPENDSSNHHQPTVADLTKELKLVSEKRLELQENISLLKSEMQRNELQIRSDMTLQIEQERKVTG